MAQEIKEIISFSEDENDLKLSFQLEKRMDKLKTFKKLLNNGVDYVQNIIDSLENQDD